MPAAAQPIDSAGQEWGNTEQILARFGLKKATLLKLAQRGAIESIRLRLDQNSTKTVRLFRIQSVRDFLARASAQSLQ